MSSIPNSVMPHAQAAEPQPERTGSFMDVVSGHASSLMGLARENKTAVAASGAAIAAGAIAAAAIPFIRARSAKSESASSGRSKSNGRGRSRKAAH